MSDGELTKIRKNLAERRLRLNLEEDRLYKEKIRIAQMRLVFKNRWGHDPGNKNHNEKRIS